jgi:hypothetical protein
MQKTGAKRIRFHPEFADLGPVAAIVRSASL